jgi:hypothetical protein
VTPEELNSAALRVCTQDQRLPQPSKANQEVFDQGVREVAEASRKLLESLQVR